MKTESSIEKRSSQTKGTLKKEIVTKVGNTEIIQTTNHIILKVK